MTLPPVREPYSLTTITRVCLQFVRGPLASGIDLACSNASAGVLNKATAAALVEHIHLTLRMRAQDVAFDLKDAADACGLNGTAIDALAAAHQDPVGLERVLKRAHDCAETIARESTDTQNFRRDLRRNLDSARDRNANLVQSLGSANRLVRLMSAHSDGGAEVAGRPGRSVRVAPVAGRVLAAAAHLLPRPGRARYTAEFRSELWELA